MSLVADYNHILDTWEEYHDYPGTYYSIYYWLLSHYNKLESKKDVEDLLFRFSYYKDSMKSIVDDFIYSKTYEGLRKEIKLKN